MAVTPLMVDHTPIPGHSFPASNKKRQFTKWVESKENRKTPWTDYVPRNAKVFEQLEYETGQSYTPFITTAIKTQTLNNANSVDVDASTYIRAGDTIVIIDYYPGSTTELDYATREYASVLAVTDADTLVLNRHEGEVASGSWAVHPVGSYVQVIGRGTNYNAAFPDGITWRGDIITNYLQRIDSGEIPYDPFAAKSSPTYESENQMLEDRAKWRKILLKYRETMFIEGRKVAGNYAASPKVPYKCGGAIWWSEQKAANLFAVNGTLSIFDFSDALQVKWENHDDGPGLDMWMGPKTRNCIDSLLLPFKEGRLTDTTITNKLTGINTTWGDLKVNHAHGWPEGKILLCAKDTFAWNNAEGMDWRQYERDEENLGAYQVSWNMAGDFGFVCNDVQRPILLTGVDTRVAQYAGRNIVGF